MSKFNLFLEKYGIKLGRKKYGSLYATYNRWRNGDVRNPTINSLELFYQLHKHAIKFDKEGLYNCFYQYQIVPIKNRARIFNVMTDSQMLNSLFCIKSISMLPKDKKILVIDQCHYSDISTSLNLEWNDDRKYLNSNEYKQGQIRSMISKSSYNHIDMVKILDDSYLNNLTDDEILDFIKLLRTDLEELSEYHLILINTWEHIKYSSCIYGRISDSLFFISNYSIESLNVVKEQLSAFNENVFTFKSNSHDLHYQFEKIYKYYNSKTDLETSEAKEHLYIDERQPVEYQFSELLDTELNDFFYIFKNQLDLNISAI